MKRIKRFCFYSLIVSVLLFGFSKVIADAWHISIHSAIIISGITIMGGIAIAHLSSN